MAPLTPGHTLPPPAPPPRSHLGEATATSLAKGGVAGVAGALVTAASQFLTVVVLTRWLDPSAAGTILTATALCLMAAGTIRLDSGNGLIYFIARSRESERPDLAGLFPVALAPVVALSVASATAVFVWGDPLASSLVAGPAAVPLAEALRALAVALPIVVCADVLVSATRGFGAMRPTTLLGGVLQPGAQLLLIGALVSTGLATGHEWMIPAAWALPALPTLVLSATWLRRRLRAAPHPTRAGPYRSCRTRARPHARGLRHTTREPSPGPRAAHAAPRALRPSAREFWAYAGPRAAGGAAQAVFQRLDIAIVAVLAGPAQAALYIAATRFKVVGQLVNQGLAQAAQPRLVRALTRGDLAEARRLYQATTIWLVVLTWPVWLGYALLAPWLLRVFGDGYHDGATVAAVLALTMMAATACGMADFVLIAAGRTASSTLNILGAITVTVALDVLLVPSHGALGAALGWSGGVLAKNLLPLFQIARRYDLRPFGPHSLPALLRAHRPRTRPWSEETT